MRKLRRPGSLFSTGVALAMVLAGCAATSDGASRGDDQALTQSAPKAASHVIVGNLGGETFALQQYPLASLASAEGSTLRLADAYNDMAGLTSQDLLAVVLPGAGTVALYDGTTLTEVPGSPVATVVTPLLVAFDQAREILYVYCADGLHQRYLQAFEVRDRKLTELPGSPARVDVFATELAVDSKTGNLVGGSVSTVWLGRWENGFAPITKLSEGSVGAVAVDEAGRRLYYATQYPSRLVARDLDTLAPVEGSPIALPGELPTGLAVGRDGVFVLDGTSAGSADPTTLSYVTRAPFTLVPTCGSLDGCSLPTTETGIALDRATDRLFVTVSKGAQPGQLAVWDVRDPAKPSAIPGDLSTGPVPAWVRVY